jgi:HlyD family secretion protein
VLRVVGREGQPTGVEPILQRADLTRMTAIAEVYESDVERLVEWVRTAPVKAVVTNPALPRPLSGTVRSDQDISRMIARNQVFAVGPREDADRRVVEVTVHLEPADSSDAGRFVGLQVTVTMEPNQ